MSQMVQQTIHTKETKPLVGILMIVGIVAALTLASLVSKAMQMVTGNHVFSVAVWLVTIALGVFLLRDRVLEYRYTVVDGALFLERMHGQHAKLLLNLPVMDILSFGPFEEMQSKHPEIKNAMKPVLKGCSYEKMAFTYREHGVLKMAVIQPNAEIRAALWDEEARRKDREEKWG